MSCFFPLSAYRDRAGGAVRIGRRPGEEGDKLELPCGRCVGCLGDRSRAWSIRCMHEASLYDSNLFLTLDYAPEHLPSSLSLEYRDFQNFMKRLRKAVRGVSTAPDGRRPVRFFCAGEYGAQYRRPHWHVLLFNVDFADKVRYVNGTMRSSLAEELWSKGNVVIGEVNAASAAYVAGYTLSKRYGNADHYEDVCSTETGEVFSRRPEFVSMSRRPGIGAWWYAKFGGDLFPHDHAVQDGKLYKVPSYYWRAFQESGEPSVIERVSEARYERAREVDRSESTEERRFVRSIVARARLDTYSRRDH